MRRASARRAALFAFVVALAWPGSASQVQAQQVQAPASTPLANALKGQAKDDYDAGRVLFGDGDFSGAFVKFQQAFVQAGDVRLLWNMAVCEKNLRHYGSVLTLLQRYKREGGHVMSASHRAEVDDIINTVSTLISTVTINVSEPDAAIFVDDHLVGRSPLNRPLLIDLGKRRLKVSKPGFEEQTVTQEFGGGSQMTLPFNLVPKATEARLTISAEGSISIDGNVMGERYYAGSLPGGEHTIRITAPGMAPYDRQIVLQPGQARTLNITLSPLKQGGVPTLVWVGLGVVAASGLAVGGYFLFREDSENTPVYLGTLSPHALHL